MTLLEMNGVLDNFNIRIGKTINAYSDAGSALAGTGASGIPVDPQDAIAYGSGGFTGWQDYWPAIPIRYNFPGETGFWQWSWINTNENVPLADPTLVALSNFTVNNAALTLPLTLTPQSPNVTHDVIVEAYAAHLGTWSTIKTWSNVSASTTWTLALADAQKILAAFRTKTSDSVRVTVKTKSSGAVVGTKTATATATVHTNLMPVMSDVQPKEGNTTLAPLQLNGATPPASLTNFLQTLSAISILIPGGTRPGYAAYRKRIVIFVDGKIVHDVAFPDGDTGTTADETFLLPRMNTAGMHPVSVTITDTRGRSKTISKNITVFAYAPPALSSLKVRRASNTTGTLDETGTYVRIDAYAKYSTVTVNSVNKNTGKILVKYRPVGTTTWSDLGEYTLTAASGTVSFTLPTQVNANSSYDIQVIAADLLNQVGTTVLLPTLKVPFSIGKDKGIGVGKIWETGALDIASSEGVAIDGVLQDPWPWLSSQGIIPAGANFNNLKDGKYFFNPDAGSFTNAPNTGKGMLISQTMDRGGVIIKSQQLWSLEGLTSRHYRQGTWFPWTKFYTDLDPPGADPSDIQAWVTQQLNSHAGVTSGVHGIPANAKFTDTTYVAATTGAAGLMSAADKTKLNGIATGAQVNPGAATTSAAGLMSAADKTKLNGIAAGAQVNPTKLSELTNDSEFQTSVQVASKIVSAINANVIGSGNASGVVFSQNLVNDSLYLLYIGRDASMYVVSTSSGVVRILAIAEMANAGSISTTGGLNLKIDFSTRARPWILTKVL